MSLPKGMLETQQTCGESFPGLNESLYLADLLPWEQHEHSEYNVMGMVFIGRDWEALHCEMESNTRQFKKKTSSKGLQLVRTFTFQQDNDPKHSTKAKQFCQTKNSGYRCAKLIKASFGRPAAETAAKCDFINSPMISTDFCFLIS